ncbi:hypothetical protein ADK70_13260 [Streptomyces rimosus subsp. pseudoverticillatus]|uniref:hypothetical protein n=1 Tax=Streptomyces rimosus TaxID=1927 RepID=UPI0006B2A5EE|nr:hypothetical protein [Streptomyces rimosus]KOT93960.1 hypothetical protein ADK70_13260 [Streptomyces rimosus subsp. pseudoverticillatus]
MRHQDICTFLAGMREIHVRLTGFSNDLLARHDFGREAGAGHQFRIKKDESGQTLHVLLSHLLAIPASEDFSDINEITLLARLSVTRTDCAARVAVDAYLDAAMGSVAEGESILHERRLDGAPLEEAITFLKDGVEELCRMTHVLQELKG